MQYVQSEFESNYEVADGKRQHRNVDKITGRKKIEEDTEEKIHASSIMLSDAKLGIVGKIDRLELEGQIATPVEYKRGKTPSLEPKWYDSNAIQVCAQGLLLKSAGYECNEGIIYYAESKERVTVKFTDQVIAMTLQTIHDVRQMMKNGTIPPPLVDSPKCPKCSLVGICLPDETTLLGNNDKLKPDQVRIMYPIRDDARPVYVQEQGARITKSGETIIIKTVDGREVKRRLIDVSEVTVFGNVQITTQAVKEMCIRNIPICYLTYGGRFVGATMGNSHKNIELRVCQHQKYHETNASIGIAREIVYAKIKNCSTLLKRNHKKSPDQALAELDRIAKRAKNIKAYDSLLGLEGLAAKTYFSEFSGMLKNETTFDFTGRNRRPPKDPVNAMLSLLYVTLTKEATTTAFKVGLDPFLGYLHKPKYGKPALALDMIEEFRPIIADSICITLINTGQITKSDFEITKFGTTMNSNGRKTLLKSYGVRMDSTITHPLLGYTASYRRILEVQMRLLARHLLGEIPMYSGFTVR